MKTNQTLTVAFSHGDIKVEHKTLMGDVRDLFTVGNKYREAKGLRPLDFKVWRISPRTVEFEAEVTKRLGKPAISAGRGRNSRTRAHLIMLLDAAAWIDPVFKADIYETFISHKLAQVRDMGGDAFIDLNAALADEAVQVLGKPAHRGHFITLAKAIKKRCEVEDWNCASAGQHEKRIRIEDRLGAMLKVGVVTDWGHLKDLASLV